MKMSAAARKKFARKMKAARAAAQRRRGKKKPAKSRRHVRPKRAARVSQHRKRRRRAKLPRYLVVAAHGKRVVGYFTGSGFDTQRSQARGYASEGLAIEVGRKLQRKAKRGIRIGIACPKKKKTR